MNDVINTNNRLRTNIVSSESKAQSSPKADTGAAQAKSTSTADSSGSSIVELSSSALILQMNEQIKNVPEVNDAKVDQIKQALSDGEYKTNAEVIARKYSEIESLLP